MSNSQIVVQTGESDSTASYFDLRAPNWSSHYRDDPRFARRFEQIRSLLERVVFAKSKSGRALDVGCGSGVFTELIAGSGWDAEGVDQSREMIAQAQAQIDPDRNSQSRPRYRQASIEFLAGIPDKYDLVISFSLLEYVVDDLGALEILTSLVRSGGVLVLSVPNRRGLVRIVERAVLGLRKLSGNRLMKGRGDYLGLQKHQYRASELDGLLLERGMKRIEGQYLNAALDLPRWALRFFEKGWWAAMYLAAYEKL